MFDTHCHLNFTAFEDNVDEVITQAREAGVDQTVVPSSNIETSQKAIEIAQKNQDIYAAIGIHPFHVYGHFIYGKDLEEDYEKLEQLVKEEGVVAIGEVGLDRNPYKSKKYPDYQVTEELVELQKEVFIKQIKLAIKYKKSLIIHNRGAVEELLEILRREWAPSLKGHTVFHLCEVNEKLIEFAKTHQIYISVGGNVTHDKNRQEFAKKIPLELLVLETDSPYILPEGLTGINTPANLTVILDFVSQLLNIDPVKMTQITLTNSQKLFGLI